jgi:hypothetical protein
MALFTQTTPSYLTPVYNPIQYNIYTPLQGANPDLNKYILKINFTSATLNGGFIEGDFLNLNGFIINFKSYTSSTFSNNDIPIEATLFEKVQFIEQILDNNILFDAYDKLYVNNSNYNADLILTSVEDYPQDVIVYSSTTIAASSITFTETLPEFNFLGQLYPNYAIETKLYYDNTQYNFNVTALTSSFTTNFIASYYKIFQPNNYHWFNYSDALQSVSSTDLYTLPNFTSTSVNNIFQRDLNSLHNFSSLFFQSYDNIFGNRRTLQGDSYDKWIWDASKPVEFDTTPYYDLDYKITGYATAFTNQSNNIIFDYNISLGDTVRIVEANLGTFDYICSSTTDNSGGSIRYFQLETQLSGTVKNFKDMVDGDFDICSDCYKLTQTNLGFSRSIINMSGKTSDSLSFTVSILSAISNNIEINTLQTKGIVYSLNTTGTKNLIEFLTDRPREGTTIYFPNSSSIYYQARPITLSIFLTAQLLPSTMVTGVTEYYFRTNSKIYSDNDVMLNGVKPVGLFPRNANDYNNLTGFTSGNTVRNNGLYHININPTTLLGAITSSTINRFSLNIDTYIINGPDDETQQDYALPYSETFDFNLVELCEYETLKTFVFLNSLGGWDWVDFTDDLTKEYSRSQALVNTRFDSLIDRTTVDEVVLQNFITNNYKISRIVSSEAEYEWLYELTKASRIYLIDGLDYIPVIITGIDYISIENTNQYKLNIEYRIAQTDISQKSV